MIEGLCVQAFKKDAMKMTSLCSISDPTVTLKAILPRGIMFLSLRNILLFIYHSILFIVITAFTHAPLI